MRALLVRVGEHADAIELGLAHEVEQVVEGRVGLARVADDERGAQRDAGDARADLLDERARRSCRRGRGACASASGRRCAGAACRGTWRRAAPRRWRRAARRSWPSDRRSAGAASAARRRAPGGAPATSRAAALAVEVRAVGGQVLRDQVDLDGAARDEIAHLAHDRLGGARALRAAQLRDDAERARAIAALGDLHVGGVAPAATAGAASRRRRGTPGPCCTPSRGVSPRDARRRSCRRRPSRGSDRPRASRAPARSGSAATGSRRRPGACTCPPPCSAPSRGWCRSTPPWPRR